MSSEEMATTEVEEKKGAGRRNEVVHLREEIKKEISFLCKANRDLGESKKGQVVTKKGKVEVTVTATILLERRKALIDDIERLILLASPAKARAKKDKKDKTFNIINFDHPVILKPAFLKFLQNADLGTVMVDGVETKLSKKNLNVLQTGIGCQSLLKSLIWRYALTNDLVQHAKKTDEKARKGCMGVDKVMRDQLGEILDIAEKGGFDPESWHFTSCSTLVKAATYAPAETPDDQKEYAQRISTADRAKYIERIVGVTKEGNLTKDSYKEALEELGIIGLSADSRAMIDEDRHTLKSDEKNPPEEEPAEKVEKETEPEAEKDEEDEEEVVEAPKEAVKKTPPKRTPAARKTAAKK